MDYLLVDPRARALAQGGSTKMAISRAGRWAIATDGTLFTKNAPMHA